MDTLMEKVMDRNADFTTPNEDARMPTPSNGDVMILRASVSEPFGGTAQLLFDMRRAGLNLRSLRLDVEDETEGTLVLTIEVPPHRCRDAVVARLARFPVVAAVVAIDP